MNQAATTLTRTGLGEAKATVYVTGRTVAPATGPMGLPGTIGETAAEVSRLGGTGIPVRCDHTDDQQVEALFARIDTEQGRLDVLVNSVWGGYERMFYNDQFTWPYPFWMQPVWRWDAMFNAGVRANYVASTLAAKRMVAQGSGLVRTESVMRAAAFMDLSNSESPQFIGRAVAALASDPDVMKRTGTVCVAAALAQEYGFDDIDGKRPVPLSIEDV